MGLNWYSDARHSADAPPRSVLYHRRAITASRCRLHHGLGIGLAPCLAADCRIIENIDGSRCPSLRLVLAPDVGRLVAGMMIDTDTDTPLSFAHRWEKRTILADGRDDQRAARGCRGAAQGRRYLVHLGTNVGFRRKAAHRKRPGLL